MAKRSLDKWWDESPFGSRPAAFEDAPDASEDYVPIDLQFQRAAHDPNLGKQTSELMKLSPVFYQRFGAKDSSLSAHVAERLSGMWEYLEPGAYTPRKNWLIVPWASMSLIDWDGDITVSLIDFQENALGTTSER